MLPEEVAKFIGKAGSVRIFEVEKGAIRKFADAVDDPNPLYWDDEYARNSRFGSIIAPPGFFGWPTKRAGKSPTFFGWPAKWEGEPPLSSEPTDELMVALAKAGYGRILDGGTEYEFFRPARAGDTLAASSMTKDIVEREGRAGKMVFVTSVTTYTNQNGDLVATARGTLIHPHG